MKKLVWPEIEKTDHEKLILRTKLKLYEDVCNGIISLEEFRRLLKELKDLRH